jgi:hypothetical protein
VAIGEVARAITGHVTVAMTDHYAHVDAGEKKAAVEGMLRLIRKPANDTSRQLPPELTNREKVRSGTFRTAWIPLVSPS